MTSIPVCFIWESSPPPIQTCSSLSLLSSSPLSPSSLSSLLSSSSLSPSSSLFKHGKYIRHKNSNKAKAMPQTSLTAEETNALGGIQITLEGLFNLKWCSNIASLIQNCYDVAQVCKKNPINNGNATKWELIRSVIIWVVSKIGWPHCRRLIMLG